MLGYFRINDPYRLFALFVLMVLLFLPFLWNYPGLTMPELRNLILGAQLNNDASMMYRDVMTSHAPLAAWAHLLFAKIFGDSITARHILALFILFFQAAYLGIIFIVKKVFPENTFIPSLIAVVLFSLSFDNLALTDELMGSCFLLFALSFLFTEIEFRQPQDETTFSLGVCVSIATLFFLPYIVFLPAVIVALILFARTNARKLLLLVFGFLLPHIATITLHFLQDNHGALWQYYYGGSFTMETDALVSVRSLLLLTVLPICYILVSVVMLNRLARFSKYQLQLLQAIFIWIGFCFIFFIFSPDLRPQTLIVLVPGHTFLITYFLLLIRRRKFAEINTWILLLGIVAMSWLSGWGLISSVSYSRLVAANSKYPGRSILVLGPEFEQYHGATPATGLIQWRLVRDVFEQPDYYENVGLVYKQIMSGKPEIITDPQHLLEPFMARSAELTRMYRRDGDNYVRIKF